MSYPLSLNIPSVSVIDLLNERKESEQREIILTVINNKPTINEKPAGKIQLNGHDIYFKIANFLRINEIGRLICTNKYSSSLLSREYFWEKIIAHSYFKDDIAQYQQIGLPISCFKAFCKTRYLFEKKLITKNPKYIDSQWQTSALSSIEAGNNFITFCPYVEDASTVKIFDLKGNLIRKIDVCHKTENVRVRCINIDGPEILIGCDDGSIQKWKIATGRVTAKYTLHKNCTALAALNKTVVSGSESGEILYWNSETGEVIKKLREKRTTSQNVPDKVTKIVRNGDFVAAAGLEGVIEVWNLTQLEIPPILLKGHNGYITSLLFKNTILCSAGVDGTIKQWDISSGNPMQSYEIIDNTEETVNSLEFCRGLILAAKSEKLYVLNLSALNPLINEIPIGQIVGPTIKNVGEKILIGARDLLNPRIVVLDFGAPSSNTMSAAIRRALGPTENERFTKKLLIIIGLVIGVIVISGVALAILNPQ